jgi:hypothetical protein
MNKKQRKTYVAIFTQPSRRNILWVDVVALVQDIGGVVTQGDGSRVRFDLRQYFTQHPLPTSSKGVKTISS